MSELASALLNASLLWATFRLSLAALAALAILTLSRARLPTMHRWVWATVLVQSAILAPLVIQLPVLPAQLQDIQPSSMSDHSPQRTLVTQAESSTNPQIHDKARLNWSQVCARGWLVGMLLFACIMACSHGIVRRVIRRSTAARRKWQSQLEEIASSLELKTPVQLVVHPRVGPLLARTWSGYYIVVPRTTWDGLREDQREAVLRHELAHCQRGDIWKSLAMRCIAALHWFNPVAWWTVAKFDEAAEWACDAAVGKAGKHLAPQLAESLLLFSRPAPLIRLGVSSARGAHLGKRIRRMISEANEQGTVKETLMKRLIVLGFIVAAVGTGIFRFQLVAQDMQSASNGRRPALERELDALVLSLNESSDPLAVKLARTIQSPTGQIVLRDRVAALAAESQQETQGDIVRLVLEEHFVTEDGKSRLVDSDSPLRDEILLSGKNSIRDMQNLAEACQSIADKISGNDEATLLVKRFLTEEAGPSYLYATVLRDRMRPGPAMLANSLGKALALDADGMYHVRPDAREQLSAIMEHKDTGLRVAQRLHTEIKLWSQELVDDKGLHQRIKTNGSNPLFAAMIISDQVFEKKKVHSGAVNEVLDQLDRMAIDTSKGLQIQADAQDEVTKVMDEFETLLTRAEAIRPALAQLREQVATADPVSSEFREFLDTDLALVALAKETEMATASTDQLVMSILGEAFEEESGELRLTSDDEMRDKIQQNLQEAFREMRSARRRAAPARELAATLTDRELGEALESVGGMLVVRRLVEKRLAAAERAAFEEWRDELLEEEAGEVKIAAGARDRVENIIARVQQMEKELGDNDF